MPGDSPLVTLFALASPILPDPSSCKYKPSPTPRLLENDSYAAKANARPMRICR